MITSTWLMVLLAFTGSSCSKGGASILDTFIPNFINNYKDLDHADNQFSFTATGTTTEGSFTGNDTNFNTNTNLNFTGTFKNSYVTLKYLQGVRAGKTFTGNFDTSTTNPYRLTVKNGTDIIRLQSL